MSTETRARQPDKASDRRNSRRSCPRRRTVEHDDSDDILGDLSATDKQKLDARGQLILTRSGDNWGRFENVGPEDIQVSWEDLALKIPKRVAGTYVTLPGECKYVLDGGATFSGCKWLFCVRVERITGTAHQLSIDVEGDSYDSCYTF
jgi:hypothetical protein